MPVGERAQNCEGPAVARSFQVADVPVVQVQVPQVFCGCERPCDHTATSFVSFDVEVPQIQFTGRVVDIPVVQQRLVRGVMVAVMGPF